MTALFTLALVVFVGLSLVAVLGFILFLLRFVLWAVFFPVKLLFKLIWIPIGLTLGALGLVFGTIALPVMFVVLGGAAIVGLVSLVASILLPILPFVLLAFVLWAIFRPRAAAA